MPAKPPDTGATQPPAGGRLEIVDFPDGVTIRQGDAVLSRVLRLPGATHGIFDSIAATLASFECSTPLLVLGFAGGGVVAPLRAMGFTQPIEGVDLSLAGLATFERLSTEWCGAVDVHQADAGEWLASTDRRFDLILEDLSIEASGVVTKPLLSSTRLPALIADRLAPGGTAVFNLLERPAVRWPELLDRVAAPFQAALLVRDNAYENRLLVASSTLPAAGIIAAKIHQQLQTIDSRRAGEARVQTWR